jgi:hypothetical protein
LALRGRAMADKSNFANYQPWFGRRKRPRRTSQHQIICVNFAIVRYLTSVLA